MRILVLSDSHGREERVNEVLRRVDFDYLFFLGDGIKDLGTMLHHPHTVAVRGNCDFFSRVDDTTNVEVAGVKFLLTHGDRFHVKSTIRPLIDEAKYRGAEVVLYGHTHRFNDETIDDIRFVNCPSLHKSHDGKGKFLVLEVDDKKISISCNDF